MPSWYVIRRKSRKDILLCQQLQAHGIEVFFPQINIKPVNPRASKSQAYFPGYMFVHIDIDQVGFSMLNWMPYSLGLVRFGRDTPRVPDELIHAVRKQVLNSRMPGPASAFQRGDLVMIERGPFAGYKALFD